jgi:uncharacterized protein
MAASKGHLGIVKHLLEHGAELDVSEPEKNPLFAAVLNGHADVVQLLLDSGIDATVTYNGHYTDKMDAIEFAKMYGQTEIAELIREHLQRKSQG